MNSDIYNSPESEIKLSQQETEVQCQMLASRQSRFWASLIDTIILAPIFLLILYLFDLFGLIDHVLSEENQSSFLLIYLIGFSYIPVFFIINFIFLFKNGQTIGKKLVGIKIVDNYDKKAKMLNHILPRYLVYYLPNGFKVIGPIFSTINVLFIFRSNKKCLHDSIAKTKVIYS